MELKYHEDDAVSYCGSMHGDTLSRRRKRKRCSLRLNKSLPAGLAAQGSKDSNDMQVEKVPSDAQDKPVRFNTCFHHYRFLVIMMTGLSTGFMIMLRYNISVAIVKMVNQTALYMNEHPNRTVEDFLNEGYHLGGEFEWSNEVQQMIMSLYMIAYSLPQLPATKLAMKIGGKWVAPISLSICAIANLLSPVAAYSGWQWLLFLRLVNGIGAAALFPMVLYMVENWMPYDEFSLGLTLSQTTYAVTQALCPLFCGYFAAIHWSYAFYAPAIMVLIFCALWLLLITDQPDENSLISQEELDLIHDCGINNTQESDLQTGSIQNEAGNENSNASLIDVFRTVEFYAYISIWTLLQTSHVTFVFILPTYLRQFLLVRVAENGTLCTIIMSGALLAVCWPHPFLRILQTKLSLSLTASRRICYMIICLMTALTWIYVGLFHADQIVILFINRCFQNGNDIIVTGSLMSNYSKSGISSLVFSMVNTVGNLSIALVSPLVGYVLDYTGQSVAGWSWIFYSLGLANLLMLMIFGSLIKSVPIQLGKRVSKNDLFNTNIQVNSLSVANQTELAASGDKPNGTLKNNFDKLRAVQKTISNNSSDNGIEMKI